jgi:hypothetical protein
MSLSSSVFPFPSLFVFTYPFSLSPFLFNSLFCSFLQFFQSLHVNFFHFSPFSFIYISFFLLFHSYLLLVSFHIFLSSFIFSVFHYLYLLPPFDPSPSFLAHFLFITCKLCYRLFVTEEFISNLNPASIHLRDNQLEYRAILTLLTEIFRTFH